MEVKWLEQTEADLPAENDWLSAREAVRLNAMQVPKRRADWRLGRWTAKRALALYLNLPTHGKALAAIEVFPGPSGAPVVFLDDEAARVTISLSHRSNTAMCAIAPRDVALGCDLELVEPRSDAFVAAYFTASEQRMIAQVSAADRFRLVALLWSAKESALKALREGLRLDTRSVSANLDSPLPAEVFAGWLPLRVGSGEQVFHGWWQQTGSLLRTVVAAPAVEAPIVLEAPLLIHHFYQVKM
jgi:4'-phosphopantetheinyl transferase